MGRTRFIGREAELARLVGLLEDPEVRAVGVVGPVGVGKTRLAEELMRQLMAGERHWDVRSLLVEEPSLESLLWSLADAAGVSVSSPVEDAVLTEIAGSADRLWILDCSDRLDALTEQALRGWCDRFEGFRLLVLSQRGLPWTDHVVRLKPLSLPTEEADGEAFELFLEHARKIDPDLRLDDHARRVVREIVGSVDGLPLAISLAASRLRVMGLASLSRQLEARSGMFEVLDPTPREPDLRLAIDELWHGLPADERELLTQLSVFRGPFDVEAVKATVDLDGGSSVLALLTNLSDRCLLEPDRAPGAGGARLRLLRPIAARAAAKLDGELASRLEDRRAVHLVSTAEAAVRDLKGAESPRHVTWLRQNANALEAIFSNEKHTELHARLAVALDEALSRRGYSERRLRALDLGLERGLYDAPDGPGRAGYWRRRSEACAHLGEAERALEAVDAAAAAPAPGDPRHHRAAIATLRARVLFALGRLAEARAAAEEAVDRARGIGDRGLEGTARHQLCKYFLAVHKPARVIEEAEKMMSLKADDRDPVGRNAARLVLATGMMTGGRMHEGITILEETLHEAREVADDATVAYVLLNLALAKGLLGADDSEEAFVEARAHLRREGGAVTACLHDINWAYSRLDRGATRDARARLEDIDRRAAHIQHPFLNAYREILAAWVHLFEGDDDAAARAAEDVVAQTRKARVVVPIYRAHLAAAVSRHRSDPAGAREWLSEARLGLPDGSEQFEPLNRVVEALIAMAEARGRADDPAQRDGALDAMIEAGGQLATSLAETRAGRGGIFEERFIHPVSARMAGELCLFRPGSEPGAERVVVGPRGHWVRFGDEHVDLSTRRTMSTIVEAIARAAVEGRRCSPEELIEAGWPGEKLVGRSASARLQVAISSLRKLGLREALVTVDGDYAFRGDLAVLSLVGEPAEGRPG